MSKSKGTIRTILMAGAAAAALGALGVALPGVALAADEHQFAIGGQDLGAALRAFALASGKDVVFDPGLVRGKRTNGARGALNDEDALRQILSGSGLAFDRTASGGFVVRAARADEIAAGEKAITVASVEVTGTNIRGVAPASPVIVVGRDQIDQSGYTSAGDLIRSLPESFSGGLNVTVIGAAGSANIESASGSSTANLRGLGSDSTLTLVNGHRLAFADTISATDISLIPLVAIKQVDVMTDGGSAIYGADAVAGVVNFVLRDRFDGVQTSVALGDSTDGGGFQQTYGVAAGRDWGDGGLIIAYEHQAQDPIDTDQRKFISPTLAGTSLTPQTDRDSVYFGGSSVFGDRVSNHWDALATWRSQDSVLNEAPFLPGLIVKTHDSVVEYGVSDEVDVALSANWRLSAQGTVAGDRNVQSEVGTFHGAPFLSEGTTYDTGMQSGQVKLDGTLLTTAAGPVTVAAGAGYRRESFDFSAQPPTTAPISKDRGVTFGFGEVHAPLVAPDPSRAGLDSLEFDAAVRWENYTDFGSATTPKVGLVYRPHPDLKLMATWGESFRAPSLLQEYDPAQADLEPIPDPLHPPATIALIRFGGNPDLRPETAKTWTAGAEFTPHDLPGALFAVHVFDIDYRNRIAFPLSSTFDALIDPLAAPFVERDPSAAEQAAAIAASSSFLNLTGAPYNPATVGALVDDRYQNIASQKVRGVDLLASYSVDSAAGKFAFSLNATWLDLTQVSVAGAPAETISGTVFDPPSFRARGSVVWSRGPWSLATFVNYVGSSKDNSAVPATPISSWTTADAQLAYHFASDTPLRDAELSVSVQNIADTKPPFVAAVASNLPGLNFDSTNASAVGRFVTIRFVKRW